MMSSSFDNGPYRTMLSGVMALCLWKFTVLIDVRSLKSNSFDQNFMKLGHIVKYHDVFFFDNGPYCTMLSGVMTLCSFKFIILDGVQSINPVKLITTL